MPIAHSIFEIHQSHLEPSQVLLHMRRNLDNFTLRLTTPMSTRKATFSTVDQINLTAKEQAYHVGKRRDIGCRSARPVFYAAKSFSRIARI